MWVKMQARVKVMDKIKEVFRRHESQPLTRVRDIINPILRGWVQYFKIGNSSKVFGYVKDWLTRKSRRHLMKAKGKRGFGWKQWSTKGLYAVSLRPTPSCEGMPLPIVLHLKNICKVLNSYANRT